MEYIKKTIAGWEKKYGQISLTGSNYRLAIKLFDNYLGKTFQLNTYLDNYKNKNFLHEKERKALRLACRIFFEKLNEGDIIYLIPSSDNIVEILNTEPKRELLDESLQSKQINKSEGVNNESALHLITNLVSENMKLREDNENLLEYKDKYERFQDLDIIFDDEAFFEDWLERNIHKVLPDIEIIGRQLWITWKKSWMRNRLDFLCLDRTTKELVVIENKVLRRHQKVENQILSYRAWVLDNLEEINDLYNKMGFNLKATRNFKFVVITTHIDERLESICLNHKIGLIHVDGKIDIFPIVPYNLV